MGVPKFFRWISERYPKINQPIHAPPNEQTQERYFPSISSEKKVEDSDSSDNENNGMSQDKNSKSKQDHRVYIQKNSITPEFDRLYLDMNGILHSCSHNNAAEDNASVGPDEKIDPSIESSKDLNSPIEVVNEFAKDSRDVLQDGTVNISEAEVFRNVCYYVDRVVTDIVQPKELVYMAIDGVAPRAKMNQQRSRRYRSGKEKEIESTFYGAHLLAAKKKREKMEEIDLDENLTDEAYDEDAWQIDPELYETDRLRANGDSGIVNGDISTERDIDHASDLQEVEPGRYTGKFDILPEQVESNEEISIENVFDLDYDDFLRGIQGEECAQHLEDDYTFHSNQITPGTPFFERCTAHLEHFVKRKLHTDPRWKDLTIIFSGPNVPGEGEHKIMDFIRSQKTREDYNPNTRHCLFGQDGDLIMLGLATHEPHFALLREEVVFSQSRKKQNKRMAETRLNEMTDLESEPNDTVENGIASTNLAASIDSYIHNTNFDILHMSILRDYLAYEFETRDVLPNSPFDLEKTIDDFVFMTFIVGNDFLPHMPAIDIADEAFELLFYTYKKNRWRWLKSEASGERMHPYLTNAGEIVSGQRLEDFFAELGKHEDPYYNNKKRSEDAELKRMREADKKAGRDATIPSDEILAAKEEWDRTNYMEMLKNIRKEEQPSLDGFKPVSSSGELFEMNMEYKFQPDSNEYLDEGFLNRMGTLFRNALSTTGEENTSLPSEDASMFDEHIADLKGRYYYEKFKISPLDAEKHIALRKAYIEGLVWNLQYYYKGCVSWDWFYPYHYGPRLSDLRDIDNFLSEISFEGKMGKPLKPFEQLMACLPPSSSDLLPKPYQWLMKSPKSPIIDFYPESFTIDMNGKRWPWEAVVLLPFIDSARLVSASNKYVSDDLLSTDENRRNQLGEAVVFTRSNSSSQNVPALSNRPNFGAIEECSIEERRCNDTIWKHDDTSHSVLRPQLFPDTVVPFPGFPTLKDVPVHALTRRKLYINVFGMRSRYRTAVLELDTNIPMITSAKAVASKFIGTTIYFRYPFLQEGYVTAVSDVDVTVRGNEQPRKWSDNESHTWSLKNDTIRRQYETGEGLTGSGGWRIPPSSVTLSVRPLKEIQTLPDGSKVKVYARLEVEVPIVATLWSPTSPDPRFSGIPAKLEKNPYRFGSQPVSSVSIKDNKKRLEQKSQHNEEISSGIPDSHRGSVLPGFSSESPPGANNGVLPLSAMPTDINIPLKNESSPSLLPPPLVNPSAKNGMMGSSNNFCTISEASLNHMAIRRCKRNILKHSLGVPLMRIQNRRFSPGGLASLAYPAGVFLVNGISSLIKPIANQKHQFPPKICGDKK